MLKSFKYLILIATLCLCACMPKSIYFKNINISELYCDNIIHTSIGVPDYIDYSMISKRLMCRINLDFDSSSSRKTVKQVIFYHKSTYCPIFAYTREELLKMKSDAGFNDKSTDAIFLVTKSGIKVISSLEYEKLKKNFKPEDIVKDIPCDKTLINPELINQETKRIL